ncbi:MAG: hypothetical protein ACLFPF_08675 [Halanaerobiales bacterium]
MIKQISGINKNYIIFIITALLLIVCISEAFADQGDVTINPGNLNFTIEDPVDDVPPMNNKNITVKRKKKTEGNVYYRVRDYHVSDINLAEYVMARTPYDSDFQNLNNPVLFSQEGDERVEIEIIIRIDEDFWINVPDGNYKLELYSDKGGSVQLKVNVEKSSLMIISPGNVNILADSGPGLYKGHEPVNVNVNNNNHRWSIDIEVNPLTYQGNYGNAVDLQTSDIYLSVDSRDNYFSMENIYRLYGSDYGKTASIDLYFQVDVGQQHIAGDYSGEVIFTISEY